MAWSGNWQAPPPTAATTQYSTQYYGASTAPMAYSAAAGFGGVAPAPAPIAYSPGAVLWYPPGSHPPSPPGFPPPFYGLWWW